MQAREDLIVWLSIVLLYLILNFIGSKIAANYDDAIKDIAEISDDTHKICHNHIIYHKGNVFHREDGPAAIIGANIIWAECGLRHREFGPAVTAPSGSYWYWQGMLHREDGPAVVTKDNRLMYFQYGVIHRDDGPAVITAAYSIYYDHGIPQICYPENAKIYWEHDDRGFVF